MAILGDFSEVLLGVVTLMRTFRDAPTYLAAISACQSQSMLVLTAPEFD